MGFTEDQKLEKKILVTLKAWQQKPPKNEAHREKDWEKMNISDLWDKIKHSIIHVVRVESQKKKKNI